MMRLSPDEMNTIKGLVHYLNESFDGHGLVARVELFTEDEEASPRISIPVKGMIEAERIEPSKPEPKPRRSFSDDPPDAEWNKPSFLYAWSTGDD